MLVAICAALSLVVGLLNLMWLMTINKKLKQRDLDRSSFYSNLRRRVGRIERYLILAQRSARASLTVASGEKDRCGGDEPWLEN